MSSNTKKIIARYVFWALAVLLMVFIFWNSAQTAEQSSDTSKSFTEKLLISVLPEFSAMEENRQQTIISDMQFIVRKGAHFSVYLALGICCFSALNTYKIKDRNKLFFAMLICLLYAVSDETHQLFVPGRAGRVTDVLLDLSGSVTGVFITLAIVALYRKKTNKGECPVKKKELINRLNLLIDSMNSLQHKLASLERENQELKEELCELRSRPASAGTATEGETVAVDIPAETSEGFTVSDIESTEPETISYNKEETPASKPETKESSKAVSVDTEPVVLKDEAMEYGSVAIGTVVQESIKYANAISLSDAENKKELLNLIMGKGEIAKAEIFGIIESDCSVEVKRELIDKQVAETVDYFKSVSGQI